MRKEEAGKKAGLLSNFGAQGGVTRTEDRRQASDDGDEIEAQDAVAICSGRK